MDFRYELRYTDDGQFVNGCDRCGADAPTAKFCEGHEELLCKFCAETELGNVIRQGNKDPRMNTTVPLARAIAQAMNLVYWKQP